MRADQGPGAGWEVSGGAGRPHKAWEGDGQCLEITEVLFVREGGGQEGSERRASTSTSRDHRGVVKVT